VDCCIILVPRLLTINLQTCKELYKALESRNVWHHTLRDLLSVIPLPSLRRVIPQLSVKELKAKAIIAARLAHMWRQDIVTPRVARKFECDCDVARFQLLPGGKWLVVAKCDGSLELHDLSLGEPEIEIVDHTLYDEDWHIDSFAVDLRLSVSRSGEILAILTVHSSELSHRG
jgi:hypothetical protein